MSQGETRRVINVGLLWHSPNSGNLGVGALTLANLALARQAAADLGLEPRFQIVSMRDLGAFYLDAPDVQVFTADTKSMISPSGYWSTIGRQDCALDIGAGDSFTDIYSRRRFAFLWGAQAVARLRGVPLMLSPQTIGPFSRFPYKQLAALNLRNADAVVARDPASLEALQALAPTANGLLSVDVAFALPFEDRSALRGSGRYRVGVNVSGLLFHEAVSGRNRFGLDVDYAALMRRFINQLMARPDVEVHLVTHANSTNMADDDDGRTADILAAEFPGAVRAPDFTNPSEAKSYISSLDFLVAGRMHACIAAVSAGVPVVPVAYSRKFSGLFGQLDYSWIVPVKGMATDDALAFLNDCLAQRDQLAKDAAAGMTKVDRMLDVYRAELRRFFATAAGR